MLWRLAARNLGLIVRERSRVVATLAALGLRRWALLLFFIFEGACLGVVGAILGGGLAVSLVAWLGIRRGVFTASGGLPATVRPYLLFVDVVVAVVVVSALAALVGATPAWRATRPQPSELL